MARLGNGAGHGPGRGTGWGGPARSVGRGASKAPVFNPGNQQAAGPHDMARDRRRQRLMAELEHLAFTAEREETQLAATIAWLDRYEGKPVARVINVGFSNAADIDDAIPAALVAKHEPSTSDEGA